MKKILFGITSLTLGGAERTLVDIANRLCDRYEITIFSLYAKGELEKELSDEIKMVHFCEKRFDELSQGKKWCMAIKILLTQKKIYKKYINGKYEKEIAFLEGPMTRIIGAYGERKKKIAWIHNDITKVFGESWKAKVKNRLDKKAYQKFEQLVFVSKDNLAKFEQKYKTNNQLEVIYNYIEKDTVIEKSNQNMDFVFPKDVVNFVTVARLVEQKAIDRLIEIHSELIRNGFQHNFYIIGEGSQRASLEKLIKEKKVENTFKLLGKKENPYPYMKQGDYFCLLTYFEGYPMVLEEAKILNQSILITDTAARETVENYERVKIFPNTKEGIYKGLEQILKKQVTDSKKGKNKEKSKTVPYDNQKLIEKIVEIIEK